MADAEVTPTTGVCPKCKKPWDDHRGLMELGPEKLLCPHLDTKDPRWLQFRGNR